MDVLAIIEVGPNVKVVRSQFARWCVYVLEQAGDKLVWNQYDSGLTQEDAVAVAETCAAVNARYGGRPADGYEE